MTGELSTWRSQRAPERHLYPELSLRRRTHDAHDGGLDRAHAANSRSSSRWRSRCTKTRCIPTRWASACRELRAQPQVSKPANEAFVTFMNAIEDKEEWEETIERLVGIYRVLKPHLISHYSSHLSAMNPVYEPPTLRILAAAGRGREAPRRARHRAAQRVARLEGKACARAAKWQSHLEGLLGASGGVTGFEAEAEAPRRKVGRS